jgi:cell wall-associated NlpC family hydrolase
MIVSYQKRKGLTVDGTFNAETQKSLIPPPPLTVGQKIANVAHAGINEAPCHYTQARPCVTSLAGMKAHGCDCSAFAMICLSAVVSGYSTGYGNTWTLIAKGTRVARSNALPGDLVFYGPRAGDPTHVAVYLGDGFVASQGHEGGPYLEAIDYRDDRIDIRRYA